MSGTYKYLATLGFIGYAVAPGTLATLCTLPIIALFLDSCSLLFYFLLVVIISIFSYFIIEKALPFFSETDPPEIVLDELIGCFITFYCIPLSWLSIIVGFLLFRLFDISKIGLHRFEKFNGALGILLDDIVAGVFANIILRMLLMVVK